MRTLMTLALLVAFPSSLLAQDPAPPPSPTPLTDQGVVLTQEIVLSRELTIEAPTPEPLPERTPTYERKLFWLGLGLALTGAVLTGLAVTSERESDLSNENPNTRINVNLAPCGTRPDDTNLPIADCKVHSGLLSFGLGVTAAGTGLVWYSIDAAHSAPAIQYRVRF